MKRRSIKIDGLAHQKAIPVGCKTGPLFASSVIAPFNPGTREVPEAIVDQYRNIFRHAGLMLEAAGGGWEQVTKMEFWLAQAADRPALEPLWLEHFPDLESCAARHTHVGGVKRMSASVLAYIPD